LENVEKRMQALQNISLFDSDQRQKLITQIPWASTLPHRSQEKLSAMIEHGIYEAGQIIAKQDEALTHIGIVSRGSIRGIRMDKNSRYTLGPGETFASLILLNGLSPATYEAETLTEIMWLPCEKLRILMMQDPQLAIIAAGLLTINN
jgi:CRP-like cAMP-binding protein